MTPAQKQMVADGLPLAFILSKAERKAAWDANPPKPYYPKDPRIEQDRQLRAEQKKEQTQKRIDALRKSKGLPPIYDSTIASTQPQEDSLPKYVIKPLDKHGHPVMRAVSSILDDATDEQINEKVLGAVKRGGSKVTNVVCVNTLSEVVLAWAVTRDLDGLNAEISPCDVEPFKTAPQLANADAAPAEANEAEAVTEESKMAKKSKKAKKAPKAKAAPKAKGAGGLRAGSKQELLYNMLTRKSGCTTDEAVKATGWKSCGLTVWGKKFGLKVTKEKNKEGTTRYYGA